MFEFGNLHHNRDLVELIMWGSSILPIAALAALPCATAITLHKRSDPAVLGLPITRTQRSNGLQKRDSKIANTTLYNVVRKRIPMYTELHNWEIILIVE